MPEIPFDQLTQKQLLRYIAERQDLMAQEIEDLKTAVADENAEDLLVAQHDVEQDARIAELVALLSGSEAERQAASQALDDTLAAVREQVTELQKDDAPADPAPAEDA